MSGSDLKQKLAAILAADVAGYSRLMAADERATVAALDGARAVFRSQIEANGGRVIDMAGDSVLAAFDTAEGAVSAALAAQEALDQSSVALPEDRRMRFRVGVHLGDVIEKDDGTIYGDGVNVAARLEALAEPGGVAVSNAVEAALRNRIAVKFEDRGEHGVKNMAHPVHAFALRAGRSSGPSARPRVLAPAVTASKPTIAVLAFENMSADPEQEHFGNGIAEDIITDLSKISGLAVVGRQSSFAYKGTRNDLRQVARELGVRYVLEGSVRSAGGRVRVNAQLIEADAGTHLWANRYDRELGDVFLIGDEIAEDIVTSLDVKLARGEDARVWRKAVKSPAAREIFMRGLEAYYQPSPQNVRTAREHMRQVIELEPSSAYPHGMLAFTYMMEVMYGWSDDIERSLAEADRYSRRALELDDTVAGGHYVQGFLALFRGQHAQALEAAARALERRPMCSGPRAGLAYIELYSGNLGSAVRHAEEAVALNPVFPGWYLYVTAAAEYFGGRSTQALSTLDRALVAAPGLMLAKILRVAVLSELGRHAEARAAAAEILASDPEISPERLASTQPFKDVVQRERYLTTLREAGLFAR